MQTPPIPRIALWLFAWTTRAPNLARLGRGRFLALLALRTLILAALGLSWKQRCDAGKPIVVVGPDTPAGAALLEIADKVMERVAAG